MCVCACVYADCICIIICMYILHVATTCIYFNNYGNTEK